MQVIPHSQWTIKTARQLRKGDNPAEGALWNMLKARKLAGHKFVRQHPVGCFFVDFAHRQQKLAIEVDGSQHVENLKDARRDTFLVSQGYSVLRFWSRDVLQRRSDVCETILAVLEGRMEPMRSIDVVYLRANVPSPSRAVAQSTSPASGRGG
jgi:very-short-patch-repair endonuclease